MHLHSKRPYSKPAITIIPIDSQRYVELMQSLPQQGENRDESNPTDNFLEKEEDKYV